jgi:hypothetical protein
MKRFDGLLPLIPVLAIDLDGLQVLEIATFIATTRSPRRDSDRFQDMVCRR